MFYFAFVTLEELIQGFTRIEGLHPREHPEIFELLTSTRTACLAYYSSNGKKTSLTLGKSQCSLLRSLLKEFAF